MKQLTENLYFISKGFAAAPAFVIVKNEKELLLVDTGLAKDASNILKQIELKWGSTDKIKSIIITHRHLDHTGGLEKILEQLDNKKIELITHKDEESHFNEDFQEKNIKVSKTVKHNDYIDKKIKLKAIHTPGHTFGHLCLLFENEKILLIGDLIMDMFGRLSPVFKRFHDDFELWEESLPSILDYEWKYAIPSHMRAKKIPRDKIEKFIEKKTR